MTLLPYMFLGAIIGFFGSFVFSSRIENSNPIGGLVVGTLLGMTVGLIIIL